MEEQKYLFLLRLEVQLILRFLLKWSFAFLRSFASKSPQAYLIVKFFSVFHSLSSVIFELLRWFIQILFPLLSYQSIRSFQSYRRFMKTFSSSRYVTSQSFSRRISNMQKSIACHQFNLMKDKHTINLILISSKWAIPFLQSLFVRNKFLIPSVFIYSFPEFQDLSTISPRRFI